MEQEHEHTATTQQQPASGRPFRSATIMALATALAKAQGEIRGALKDSEVDMQLKRKDGSEGQRIKLRYADLASVWDACREPLAKNGLSIVQLPSTDGPWVRLTTLLLHESGEWISNDLDLQAENGSPQKLGSAITYARRYALSAMVGIAPEEDDGAAASGTAVHQEQRPAPQQAPRQDTRAFDRSAPSPLAKFLDAINAAETGSALESIFAQRREVRDREELERFDAAWYARRDFLKARAKEKMDAQKAQGAPANGGR